MKKRITLLIIFSILLISSLTATPEIWSGVSVSSGRNYFATGLKQELTENPIYSGVNMINTIGPGLDITVFPYSGVRIGLAGSADFSLTISRDGSGYFSRHYDHSTDLSIGIAYYQLFGNDTWGFFLDGRYFSRQYTLADSNGKNDKQEVVHYYKPNESGFNASIGFLAKYRSSYFRMGFRYSMPTSFAKKDGWGLELVTGGGICF
ncbi:MAG: hypothetical protein ACI4NM_03100 [Bullifex sp.]